jgi:hypothetical protein
MMNLCATVPGFDTDSDFAGEGRLAHKVGETALANDLSAADLVGRTVMGAEVEPKIADSVEMFVDYVRGLFTSADGKIIPTKRAALRLEQEVSLTGFDPYCKGRYDASLYDAETDILHLPDYKHGAGVPVDAEDSDQLQFYGLGALLALGHGCNIVKLSIIQPN